MADGFGGCDVQAVSTIISHTQIEKVENGFIVRVGCKTFVAKEWNEVSVGLALYFEKPEEARKKY